MFGWFKTALVDRRVLVELRLIRIALQEIAGAMQTETGTSGTSLHSYYQSDEPPEAAQIFMQDDAELANLERLEREKEHAGFVVAVDEELGEE